MKKIMNHTCASAFLLLCMVNATQASTLTLAKAFMRILGIGGVGSGGLYYNQKFATDNKLDIDAPMQAVKEQLQPAIDATQAGLSVVQEGLTELKERGEQLLQLTTEAQDIPSRPDEIIGAQGPSTSNVPAVPADVLPEVVAGVLATNPSADTVLTNGLGVHPEQSSNLPLSSKPSLPEGATPRQMTPAFSIKQVVKPVLVVCAIVGVTYGAYKAYEYYKARRTKSA